MPNRYVTAHEKRGAARRTNRYRSALRQAGLKPRQYWITDHEHTVLKRLIMHWRGVDVQMSEAEAAAADTLNPNKNDA